MRHHYDSKDVPEIVFNIVDGSGVPFHAATLKFWTDGTFGWLDVKDGQQTVASAGIHIDGGKVLVEIYSADPDSELIHQHVVDDQRSSRI